MTLENLEKKSEFRKLNNFSPNVAMGIAALALFSAVYTQDMQPKLNYKIRNGCNASTNINNGFISCSTEPDLNYLFETVIAMNSNGDVLSYSAKDSKVQHYNMLPSQLSFYKFARGDFHQTMKEAQKNFEKLYAILRGYQKI